GRVRRGAVVWLVGARAVIVARALPALHLHMAEPDSNTLKPHFSSALTDRMLREFPSTSEPALLVVKAPAAQQARVDRAITKLEAMAAARGIAHPPFTAGAKCVDGITSVALPLTWHGNNSASRDAVESLRNELIPKT